MEQILTNNIVNMISDCDRCGGKMLTPSEELKCNIKLNEAENNFIFQTHKDLCIPCKLQLKMRFYINYKFRPRFLQVNKKLL